MPRALARNRRDELGAAALIVVLVLFFIVSLVAAYTSRGMVFEQRTATNTMRATQALEIGDAGIEWVVTKLNAGLISPSCETTTAAGADTFRQRYLTFSPTSGAVTGVAAANATCVMQPATGWVCTCPTLGSSAPTAGDGPFPAFRVYFAPDGTARTNQIRVTVSACTDAGTDCLSNPQISEPGKGNVSVSALLGLKGAIDTIPAAAVTLPAPSTGSDSLTIVAATGTTLAAYNGYSTFNNVPLSGIAIHAGGTLPAVDVAAAGPAGMPAEQAKFEGDLSLSSQAGTGGLRNSSDAGACAPGSAHPGCSFNRMFTSVFGTPRAVFRDQPGLVRCTAGCNSAALALLAAKNPRSVILVTGDATLDANLGTAADPVALVVEGDVSVGAGATVTGLIYSTGNASAPSVCAGAGTARWSITGAAVVQGAIISENPVTLCGGGALEVRYDPAVLFKLRREYGSFVRVPGGWRDFPAS